MKLINNADKFSFPIDKPYEDLDNNENQLFLLKKYINSDKNLNFYADYFNKYRIFLTKNTLNNFTKDILNFNF